MTTRVLKQGRKEGSTEEGVEPRSSEGLRAAGLPLKLWGIPPPQHSPSLVSCSNFIFAFSFPVYTMAPCGAGPQSPLPALSSLLPSLSPPLPPSCLPGVRRPCTDHLISGRGGPACPEGDSPHRLWLGEELASRRSSAGH